MKRQETKKGLKGLAIGALAAGVLVAPAVPVKASSAPAIVPGSVFLSASAKASAPGERVTLYASAKDPGGQAEYEFWIKNPDGTWSSVAGYSPSARVTLSSLATGSYLAAVTVLDRADLARHRWDRAVTSAAFPIYVGCRVYVSAPAQGVAAGQVLTVNAAAPGISDPRYQFWIQAPSGRWQSSGNYSQSPTYAVREDMAGPYRVVVYAKEAGAAQDAAGSLWSKTAFVPVYGRAAAVAVSLSPGAFVANGVQTKTLTVKVVDKAGDTVADYTGSATLRFAAAGENGAVGAFQDPVTGQWERVTPATTVTVPISRGQAALTVEAGIQAAMDTMTAAVSGAGTTTFSVATKPQVATQVSLVPENSYLLANESGNPATFVFRVLDQVGEPMLSGQWTALLNISGPGQFRDLTPGPDTLTYQGSGSATAPASPTVTVYSVAGALGPMSLTASVSGLLGASQTIPAILGGQPYQMGASASPAAFAAGSQTTVTLTQLTKTGGVSDPASLDNNGYTLTITTPQGQPVYGFSAEGASLASPVTLPVAVGPNYFYAVSQTVTITAAGNVPPGVYDLIVSDPGNLLKPSVPVLLTVTPAK